MHRNSSVSRHQERDGKHSAAISAAFFVISAIFLISASPVVAVSNPVLPATELPASAKAPEIDSSQVRQYAERFDVSEKESRESLEAQARGATIVSQLEYALGTDYAGVWFDNETGEFVVPVLSNPVGSEGDVAKTAAQFQKVGLATTYRTTSAEFSWTDLRSAQEQLDSQLADQITADIVRTSLDPRTNAVVIETSAATSKSVEAAVEQLAQRSPVAVEVHTSSESMDEASLTGCNPYYWEKDCSIPLRGGTGLHIHNEPIFTCTIGYRARGWNGQPYVLTAGHCFGEDPKANPVKNWDSEDEFENLHYIGELASRSYVPHDWGKISAAGSYWDVPSWPSKIVKWTAYNEPAGIVNEWYPIEAEGWAFVGQTVYHSGETTGTSWGVVKAVNETVAFETPYGKQTFTNMNRAKGGCAHEGDSGGPVFAAETALGMDTASTINEEYYCHEPAWWFTNIEEATSELGITVVGSTPEATTTAATGVSAHQATLNGQVTANRWSTSYRFEYGRGSYSSSTAELEAGTSTSPVAENASVTGLVPASSYQFRIRATNALGTSYGNEGTFTTPAAPPEVATGGATGIDSTNATLSGTVNPENSETSYWFEYGPTTSYGSKTTEENMSGAVSKEVSRSLAALEFGKTYHYRLVAKNVAGTTYGSDRAFTTGWRLRSNPKPEKAEYDTMVSVSCLSPTDCIGVGSYKNASGVQVTLAEHWNGSSWDFQTSENPAGASRSQFNGVSCTATTSCVAVGFYQDTVSGHYLPLAERWNGTKWELLSTQPEGNRSYLEAVSCSSSTSCMAVGFYPTESPEIGKTFAEYWNGTSWTIKAPINYQTPGGEPTQEPNYLKAVSCTSSSDCTAVGFHQSSIVFTTHYEALAEHWNGTSWSVETTPAVEGKTDSWLEGVSCTSSSACTAVGYASVGHSGSSVHQSVAMRWNGTKWTIESTPNVEGFDTYLHAVSCASATFCVAVANGGLGMRWNGSKWELHYLPMPSDGPELLADWGVSCTSSTACLAAGTYRNSSKYVGSFSDFFAKTLPATPVTKAAVGITGSEATLKGTVNPNGSEAKYWFEYGTSAGYGTKTAETSAGSGIEAVSESALVTGLKAETLYHYRVVASNTEGVAYGKDETFTTAWPFDFSFASSGTGNGQFSGPGGVAVDSGGNVWVVDRGNNRIEKFNSKGEYLSQFGSKGSGNGQFSEPRDIAISSAGNLWVTDAGNGGRVEEFNSLGTFLRQVGLSEGTILKTDHLKEPYGVATGTEGHLWVTDPGSCAVEEFKETSESSNYFVASFAGTFPSACTSTENSAFRNPTGVTADSKGDVWIADAGLNRVTELHPGGLGGMTRGTQFGTTGSGNGQLSEPYGVALSASGSVQVVDKGNNRVQQFSATGEYQKQFGAAGSGAGQFSAPRGIAIASGGGEYVTDPGNNRVEKWG